MGIGREGTLGSAQGSLLRRGCSSRDLNEVREGASRFGEEHPSSETNKCRGPEAGLCLVCLRNSREAGVAAAE